jgi:hypothetical protein
MCSSAAGPRFGSPFIRDVIIASVPSIDAGRRDFVMAGLVTGIGSLPFTDAETAVQAVARLSPEVPFWPQLPKRSRRESIIGQSLDILSDLIEPCATSCGYQVRSGQIDRVVRLLHEGDGALTSSNAAGFEAFHNAINAGRFPSAVAIKGQTEGPITVAAYLFYENRSFLSDATLLQAVTTHTSQMIRRQSEVLKAAGLPVLLFIDEPAMCLNNAATEDARLAALQSTLDVVRSSGALAGLHCCASRPFERMCRAKPDILSFDAHLGLEAFFANREAQTFLSNGASVAYGLVPTWRRNLAGIDPQALFLRWLNAAREAGDPRELAKRAMVTSTCGLGLLTESASEASFRIAHAVGALLRSLAIEE